MKLVLSKIAHSLNARDEKNPTSVIGIKTTVDRSAFEEGSLCKKESNSVNYLPPSRGIDLAVFSTPRSPESSFAVVFPKQMASLTRKLPVTGASLDGEGHDSGFKKMEGRYPKVSHSELNKRVNSRSETRVLADINGSEEEVLKRSKATGNISNSGEVSRPVQPLGPLNSENEAKSDFSDSDTETPDDGFNSFTMHNFSNLRVFLKSIFLFSIGKQQFAPFSCGEIIILTSVMRKKFDISLKTLNLYPLSEFCAVYCHKIYKRPEECYKFIFKHTFKQLKKRFRERNPELPHIKTQAFLSRFYTHYFTDAAETTNLSLINFFLPLSPEAFKSKKNNVVSRTINGWYITLIAQSPEFLEELIAYINRDFLNNYKKQIGVKINNLCNRWEREYHDSLENFRTVDAIDESISKSIRCKLPWTVKEVEYSIDIVNKLIVKYKSKNPKQLKLTP